MAQTVLQLPLSKINEMKKYYEASLQTKLPPGAIFSAKPTNCTITAYKSGKILFQGANNEIEANRWASSISTETGNKPAKQTPKKRQTDYRNLSLIGSDEVGTGDFFGPITVVAAFVHKEQIQELTQLGVKDSKGMKDDEISKIAKQLIKKIPYSLLVLHNEKYNELQQKGMNQGKMKAILHNQAILHLKKKLGCTYDGILIDQFVNQDTFFSYIRDQKTKINEPNIYFETKAESIHLSVAAASIIARYAFVKEMDKLSEKAGFIIPKGAGSKVDAAAAKLYLQHGEEGLRDFCKLHFANTEKAIRIARK